MATAIKSCLFFIFLLFASGVHAQLNADFTGSPKEGCSPLKVNFHEQASGNPSSFQWFFGNGNSSDTTDPSVIYITPGKYDVTLIVSNGNESDTVIKEDYITVFANPQADFSANPLTGCAPAPISFQDQTTLGDAPIVDWLWDFGDGQISALENPVHTYQNGGSFKVSLVVLDDNGCQSLIDKEDFIQIDDPPLADFSAQNRTNCSLPHEVQFDNTTTGQGNISYEWHFGDGGTSTQQHPTHTYGSTGTYDVMLIAVNSKGCRDTVVRKEYIRTFDLQPQLGVSSTHGCIYPDKTTFEFENNTQGSLNLTFWNFGDNTTSNQQNPTHVFQEKGVYHVMLIVGNGVCLDTAFQDIHVQDLTADFSMDSSITCDTPFTVNFTENAVNANSWKWHFGDGDSATGASASHTYVEPGEYKVTLTVKDQYGCIEEKSGKVIIEIPRVNIFASNDEGCAPLNTVLIAQPVSRFPFSGYEWEFHNGNTTTGQSTSRTYNDPGEYAVQLTGTTENGCVVATEDTIKVGEPPSILDAKITEDTICHGEEIPLSLDFDLADEIKYQFIGVEGSFQARLDTPKTPHATGDPGKYVQVIMTPYFNGCPGDDYILEDTFVIIGAKSMFTAAVSDCSDPFTFDFTNQSIEDGRSYTYTWYFPDGTTEQSKNATYTFPDTGTYSVQLSAASNDGKCIGQITKEIQVIVPEARILTGDTVACNALPNAFLDGSLSAHAGFFEWTFPDTVIAGSTADSVYYDFEAPGNFEVHLQITGINGCPDEAIQEFTIHQHETSIVNAGDKGGCTPFYTMLQSQVVADATVTLYEWDIAGDSSKYSENVSLMFAEGGEYTVTLKTVDANGCSAEDQVTLISSQPEANFFPDRVEACKYDPITFENYSFPENGLSFQWFFGDGGTDTAKQPEYGFTKRGTFDVKLVVTDTFGCTDTLIREDYIEINAPLADLTVNDSFATCPPLQVDFIDRSSNDVVAWEWNFGDNSGSVLEAPQHNYTASGTYDVSLVVTNGAGCTDTVVYPELIKIGGPVGKYVISPDTGCTPLEVTFEVVQPEGVNEAEWDFGDGTTRNGLKVKHRYKQAGTYYPNLVMIGYDSNDTCKSSIEAIDTIVVDTVNANFAITDAELCEGEAIGINDLSTGNVSQWRWQIDTFAATGPSVPGFTFGQGTYQALLIAVSGLGCRDSLEKPFEVFSDPIAAVAGDTFSCEGSPAQLIGQSNVSSTYQWIPAEGIAEPDSRTPLAIPGESTIYSVIATDEHGCSDTSEGHLLTIYPNLEGTAGPDTTIIIGDTVKLFVDHNLPVTGYEWQFSATLSCDTCPDPVAFPMSATDYFVTIADTQGCDEITLKAQINVDDAVHVAIPEAFTPNGDGKNDLMFIQGWGIQELLDFRIYNRWGELVFRTSDIENGWDGTYRGEKQDVGSFVYVVKARSYSNKVVTKKGSFTLLR